MISDRELEVAARDLNIPRFRGVYSKDLLPKFPKPGYYIVNMENSVNSSGKPLPGTHWVLVDSYPDKTYYIDAFGVFPPTEIVTHFRAPLIYNSKQVQDLNSDLCGFYCLYFAFQHASGRPYSDILQDFQTYPNTAKNSAIIDRFFGINNF